ncbi:spermidine/putrescine ABC transporter ATP-binding protein [Cephaloticoccus capnophilus]|uniref:Spermidine/putrescine ABC transporter ATP-binding protein n=1 Tax=Cephaloticoccus capnophilus TaxID=1548208 RepID=A0A139SSA3_9BACT|nr:ABC transporter ATP-binding protein [Cephaloticoccus capnophilus]KXU37438.1 spermidine/putrescine ABC transporter ATP-binding protein [Cephaloticoccus capnophilus]
MISIRIDKLTKRFGAVTALAGLELEIAPGELFFLLGPSGCGKTTLLRSLAGFYTPEEGRIFFDAEEVTSLAPHKRNTGMMFQSYALWPHMSVAENVAFGLHERKIPKAEIAVRVAEALRSVHMETYADRRPQQLSGGQQQRVALARALVIRPRCLLLDEPLSNLDAKLRLEMRTEIRRVCKEFKLTTVYVTHDQKEALSIADRMAILDGGRILQAGSPRQIYKRPTCKTVAGFIGETDFLEGQVLGLDTDATSGETVATVETPLGRFEGVLGAPEKPPALGQTVTLSIRPECWNLSEATARLSSSEKSAHPAGRADKINSLRGRIGGCVYLGEVAQYDFVTEGGRGGSRNALPTTLKVFEKNPRRFIDGSDSGKAAGEVLATVEREDVVVLVE